MQSWRRILKWGSSKIFKKHTSILVPKKACMFELQFYFMFMTALIYLLYMIFQFRGSQRKVVLINVTISPKLFHWLSSCHDRNNCSAILAVTRALKTFVDAYYDFFLGIVRVHQEKRHSTTSSISVIKNC